MKFSYKKVDIFTQSVTSAQLHDVLGVKTSTKIESRV